MTTKQAQALGLTVKRPAWSGPRGQRKQDGNEGRNKLFDQLCQQHGLPIPVHEYRFHPERKWRFDYLFDGWLALEVQGGIWTAGRHVRGAALVKEHEKLNEAVCRGYSVLFCTPQEIEDGSIFPVIRRALTQVEEQP
jgi:hypothetical protein